MPTRAELALDRLHARVRANPLLQRFTVCTRILLAVGFVPPSLVKIQGERFTTMPIEHPVGFFFEAMYRTGVYWNFIGWAQLAGAVLLLHPRTATLGALLFFPIILNIFAITVSMHFAGTWVIAGLMLLACTYLLCWDYDRFKPLLWPRAEPVRTLASHTRTLERIAYAVMTASALGVTLIIRGYVQPRWALVLLAAGFAGGVCLLAAGMMELRARRAGGFAREGVAG